tara:strand:- start:407 stop:889 length:483 start_codon:yes stop_codon:yes gene_type:complete
MMKALLLTLSLLCLGFAGLKFWLMPHIAKSHATWIDFSEINTRQKANTYLICSAQICGNMADEKSPVFDCSNADLRARWDSLISSALKTDLLVEKAHGAQRIYVQYSKFWSFPDLIQVEFVNISPNQSSIQLYSRSLIGRYDFGVNQHRLQKWLNFLKKS